MIFKDALDKLPLIAILRGITPKDAVAVGKALVSCGFTCLEVPLNSPNALESLQLLSQAFDGKILLGAGTVLQTQQVEKVAAVGGKLIVMPHADKEIISLAKKLNLACVPGFATATEAFAAIAAGADALKLFPAEAAPPSVLKALKAVLPPEIPILPVGGITPNHMAPYFAAGASGFGLGSSLYTPGDTAEAVAEKGKVFVQAVKQLKANGKEIKNDICHLP